MLVENGAGGIVPFEEGWRLKKPGMSEIYLRKRRDRDSVRVSSSF